MTKVEIDGKTYCVETLIYTVKRLTKDIKASAEYHRLVLDKIRKEIEQIQTYDQFTGESYSAYEFKDDVLDVINKYKVESEK